MNKGLKLFLLILCGYLIFAGVVFIFYHQIRYDPEDGAATDFLHTNQSLKKEIGEVRYVARRSVDKELEDDNGLHISYSVKTYYAKYRVTVHFERKNQKWTPYDYTIHEILEEFESIYET